MKKNYTLKRKPKYHPLVSVFIFGLTVTLFVQYSCGLSGKKWNNTAHAAPSQNEIESQPETRTGNLPARKSQGAGLFYPQNQQELYLTVNRLFTESPTLDLPNVRAVHVPHAGYIYSGKVAAAAIQELPTNFRRVFLLAANHNGKADFSGVSIPSVKSYAIPGSEIPLSPIVDDLLKEPLFTSVPEAHTMYMIEVELPFLHVHSGMQPNPTFSIIPMIAGRLDQNGIEQLSKILNRYADDETVFIFSADLSHFYSDSQARQLDTMTIDAILSSNQSELARATTDGNHVLMTMIRLAELNDWKSTLLQYSNSGETSGDLNKVVGYAAIAFHDPVTFSDEQQNILLALARNSIKEYLDSGRTTFSGRARAQKYPILGVPGAVFVTLKKNGRLRGCIGDLVSDKPLYEGIVKNAVNAATRDTRFKPVTIDELNELDISISVLGYPQKINALNPKQYANVLKPGQDGVIMVYKGRRSTYLPIVWESLPDPVQFLSRLCIKQGSPANCWQSPETTLFRYSAYEFGEKKPELTNGAK